MKFRKIFSLLLILAVAFAFTACGGAKSYTVTFDSDGGSAVTAATVEEGKTVAEPTAPTKEGYEFKGWYDGETAWDFATAVTKDITLKAKWEEKAAAPTEYTVTFDADGGSTVAAQTVESGAKATAPAAPTKEGYTFAGWFNGETAWDFETAVTANVTLKAAWTLNTYTVTFDADGGSDVAAATVNHGAKATAPTAPTKTGYTFAGWYNGEAAWDFETAVTANVTLTAAWTANTYTVTFNANGGSDVAAVTADYNTAIAAPTAPTKTGYTFAGWYNGEVAWDFANDKVTADVTLTAKWEEIIPDNYTVTFNTAGGAPEIATQTVVSGEKATAPTAPEKTGYTFAGWYNGTAAWDFDTAVTANITLTAQWTVNTYSVVFNPDNGEETAEFTMEYGQLVAAPEVAPEKTGYTFAGWYNGETAWDFANDTVAGELELVAKWTPINYTVTFNTNGATSEAIADATVAYGEKATAPTAPERTNYEFLGWFLDGSDTAWDFDNNVVEGDMTLIARWKMNTEGGVILPPAGV